MNIVLLIGRLTKDPETSYHNDNCIAKFTVATDRKEGADFNKVTVFGKTAENCERYLKKGSQVGVMGSLRTGSYEKDGKMVYTIDVIADRVEFLSPKSEKTEEATGFSAVDKEIPF